jgi:hypothetical protein
MSVGRMHGKNMTDTLTQNNPDDSWDMIIQPQRGLLDLRLGELWKYRDLVMLFVRRDFVAVYKQTILGPLWYLIQPLLTTITFTVIFGQIASLPTDGLPQFLFYMSGTVVWAYFADCLNKTSNTFVGNANLFGKVYFPRMAVPVSILISNLITFAIQFGMFLAFVLLCPARLRLPPTGLDCALAHPAFDDGRAGTGLRHHHLLADHQVPRPALPGPVRRAIADVRHAGHLPGFGHPGALAVGHPD